MVLGRSATYTTPPIIIRANLQTNTTASWKPVGFVCTDFAFDDSLLGATGAMCLANPTSGNASLVAFNMDAGTSKTIGVFPYRTIDSSDHGYNPIAHVYYLRMDDESMPAAVCALC